MGTASPPDFANVVESLSIHGSDGLGNAGFSVSRLQHQHPSDKILSDEIHAAPDEVTVLCLGPLTNVARALQRDPQLCELVDRFIIVGGAVKGVGNVTPVAEF